MRTIFRAALAVLALSAAGARAQTPDDINRVDLFGGFSHVRVKVQTSDAGTPREEYTGFNGFDVSAAGNLSRYVGLKLDVSGHYRSETFTFGGVIDCFPGPCDPSLTIPTTTVETRLSLYNFLGGVQLKDNARAAHVKPFAHALAGAAHARFGAGGFSESETGFAAALGGGLDLRVSERVDVRAVQFDWNPTRLGDSTQHNFRVGVGVVFH